MHEWGPGADVSELNHYVSPELRRIIEKTYYAQVNQRGSFDELTRDASFLGDPARHVAFFADHGVAHVRDVARQVLRVLDRLHDVLIPPRPPVRLDFMRGFSVLMAYVHDIGMADFSPFGRTVHPDAAAQIVFDPSFDPMAERIWEEDGGGIRTRVLDLVAAGALDGDPGTILRELLAMAACHSKRFAPAETLTDTGQLRRTMQEAIGTDLRMTYARRSGLSHGEHPPVPLSAHPLRRFYTDVGRDSFRWLVRGDETANDLVEDVVDSLRVLRCADALRQRGSALRTSGSYQLFIDQITGNAICSVEQGDRMWFVELSDPVSAAEANLSRSELDADGNLRLAFHHGSFAAAEATARAVESAALVIADIGADIRPILHDRWPQRPRNRSGPLLVIEETDDNPDFARLVADRLTGIHPDLGPWVRLAPSLTRAAERERRRYLDASSSSFPPGCVRDVLRRVADAGHRVDHLSLPAAFEHVRLVRVAAGDVVVAAEESAGFVYIPLGHGLRVEPIGGYEPRALPPWSPIGVTAVVRGATRNATVIAEGPVDLLMIPRDIYLRHWYRAYSLDEFLAQLNTDA